MSEEAIIKLAVLIIAVVAAVYLGLVVLAVLAPVFGVAVLVDIGMRQAYNGKLAGVRGSPDLVSGPKLNRFEARLLDGNVLIGWMVELPGDAHLDVWRLEGPSGGSVDEIEARGDCICSTTREVTGSREELFVDAGLDEGTYHYVPVLSGLVVEKEPQAYSFFDFAREVQYITRRNRVRARGEAVTVEVKAVEIEEIPDLRDEASKMTDDLLDEIRAQRQREADLDAAIARIEAAGDLTEEEKAQAIALLETRSVMQ